MNTLYSLTYRNLKLNKKRTIVTMIGIILSVALICAVAGMVTSFQGSLYKEAIQDGGNYHVIFSDVPQEEASIMKEHREIKETFSFGTIGYARISDKKEDIQSENKPYFRVVAFDSNTIKNYPLPLLSGRLPENSNEIVLSIDFHLSYPDGIGDKKLSLGDKITLNVGTRVDKEGNVLTNHNPLVEDEYDCDDNGNCRVDTITIGDYTEEKIINTTKKEYTIVGILDYGMRYDWNNFNSPAYDIYTLLDDDVKVEKVDMYIQYKHPKNYKDLNDELNPKQMNELGVETRKYDQETNDYLLDVMGVGFSEGTSKALYAMMAIVIGIIMVSSVFVIKNGFSISIVERYKQFGMLSSVGATSRQIKRSVLFEGFLLGLIAIPIGIGCGVFADFVLVHLVNYIIKDFVSHDMIILHITLLPIVVATLTSMVTIFLSCYLPARKAAKLSIIELIRSNNSIKIKSKKLKTPKYITKLFGVGGEIAQKNLKRNKKKYRTTVVSLVVSIVIFISLNFFMNLVFDSSSYYFNSADYDLSIHYHVSYREDMSEEEIKKKLEEKEKELLNLGNPGEYAVMKDEYCTIVDDSIISEEYAKRENTYDENGNKIFHIQVVAVGEKEYERFIKKVGGNLEDYKRKAILIDDMLYYSNEDSKYHELNALQLKANDKIKLSLSDDKEIEIEIAKRTTERVLGMPNHIEIYNEPRLIVSDEYFEELASTNNFEIIMKTDDVDNIVEQLDNLMENEIGNLGYQNIHDEIRQQRAMVLIVSIFLYGFIAVITLIGVTNIFNTITTNMALRSREFAMLKAIGMTNKEFNKMIRLESILYGLKSLVIGIPIGLFLTYFIHKALTNTLETPYVLPLGAILISILFVFIIVYMTMHYSLKKINKQNIIETIREENI